MLDFILMAGGFLAARAVVFDASVPFVLPYISAFLFKGNKFFGVALFASLGTLFSFRTEFSMKYLLAIIMLCAVNLFLSFKPNFKSNHSALLQAGFTSLSAVLAGMIIVFLRGQGLYHFGVNLLEAATIFPLSIVLIKGIECIAPGTKRGPLHNEEFMAVMMLAGILTIGASDVFIWQISLRHIFAVLLVLMAAQSGGAAVSAVFGIFLGFILNLAGFEYIYFAVLLGMAGFCAGSARPLGRIAVFGAFTVAGLLCGLYFDLELISIGTLLSVIAAGLAFYFMPISFLVNIHTSLNPSLAPSASYLGKIKGQVVDRVYDYAAGYGRLASLFRQRAEGRQSLYNADKLAEGVKGEFCISCHKYDRCWGDKSDEAAGYVRDMAAKGEEAGRITIDDAPLGFSGMCHRVPEFTTVLSAMSDRQRLSRDWEQRLDEARTLVAQQFFGMANLMEEFAEELTAVLDFRTDIENKIIREFNKLRIDAESVIVIQNRLSKYEISIVRKNRHSGKKAGAQIGRLISELIGRRVELCDEKIIGSNIQLDYIESQKFYIHSGIAKINKNMAKESGDSFSLIQLRDGRCIAALSDGMGSGAKAREESEAAIELLEELMERGFDKDITLRLINSALLLKSGDEFFSTLDICLLDMNTADAEFIKIGAAASYILRDGKTEAIGSWTLPVGILESVDVDLHKHQLKHGDIVVMMTDGIMDSRKGVDKEWMDIMLTHLPKGSPQEMADYILDVGQSNYGDVVKDDMTVMVFKVLKRK